MDDGKYSRKWLDMRLVRFGAVGVVNTLIDFSVLNLLLTLSAATSGLPLVLCNGTAFLVASLNSYYLNKKWTFAQKGRATLKQYLVFLALTAGGLFVNTLVLYLLVTGLPQPAGLSAIFWVNIAKAAATVASLVWNYLAYRYVVFGKAGTRP